MISMVIPALDEAGAIEEVVTECARVLAAEVGEAFEIVVVDDGSTDGTGEIARRAGARVIRNPERMGYGFSIKRGVRAARHPTIVTIDADGTYPVAELPALLKKYDEGFDMVVGARTGAHYRESAFKMTLRRSLRALTEFVSGRTLDDINSGFRVFKRDAARRFEARLCDTFSYSTSLTLAFAMNSLFLAYVPISFGERVGKSKVRLFSDGFKTLEYVFHAAAYYNPFKIFLVLSLSSLLGSIAFFAFGVATQVASAFSIAIGLALFSCLLIAIGLFAEILRQLLAEIAERNDKPDAG